MEFQFQYISVLILLDSFSLTHTAPCPDDFTSSVCGTFENIALDKPTYQSSIYTDAGFNFTSVLAVDGNINTDFTNQTCSTTGGTNPSLWSVVLDPAIPYYISHMTLYLRNSNGDRYKNMRIFVSGSLCTDIGISDVNGAPSPNPVHVEKCDQTLRGNNVSIVVDNGFLTLCEVQIWVCSDGWFGENCENQCRCRNSSEICDKKAGSCTSGCSPGWRGYGCLQACLDKKYGQDCSKDCGSCKNSSSCDPVTGVCSDGCEAGWRTDTCDQKCTEGYYGADCGSMCGHCSDDDTCDHVDGTCPNGCQTGYNTSLCTECPDGTYGGNCTSLCGNCIQAEVCDKVTGECPTGCQPSYTTPRCNVKLNHPAASSTIKVSAIVGALVAVIVLLLLLMATLFILRRKTVFKKHAVSGQFHHYDQSVELNSVDGSPAHVVQKLESLDEAVNPYYGNIPSSIPLDSLIQCVRKKINEDELEIEYKMIRYGLTEVAEVGKRPDNRKRNRFYDLFPYDHSRVILFPDGDSTWDYINASFVSGYSDTNTYIAAQGPNSATVDDFWRMIWQQDVSKVVMLTRLLELYKKKCEQYWPENNEEMQYGNITVQTIFTSVRADFTVRRFSVHHKLQPASPKRTVTQFHFTTWPDHDVPAAAALVAFWKQVKTLDAQTDGSTGPPVVHCSAGVGRTGTFIALDSLVTQAETENKVNIFMCVAKMREARMNMVQTKEQYHFVHEALLEALESRGTFYTASEFEQTFGSDLTYTTEQENELVRQFKSLQSLKVELRKELVSDAMLPENVTKNRQLDILPANGNYPGLTTPLAGHNDYINAVMLPSATRPLFYAVTQTPLPATVVDFWRLVYDHNCSTIVCLDDSQDTTPLYPGEEKSTVGPFLLEAVSETGTQDCFVHQKMTISYNEQPDSDRHINVYRFLIMSKTSGEQNTVAILDFFNVLHDSSIGDDQKMLVHCLDGSGVSGVFCSLMNIISRLRLDKEVDIFLTIRELQAFRPTFVSNSEQYKLCHDVVKEYLRSAGLYENM